MTPVYSYTFRRHRVAEAPATIRAPRDVLPVFRAMLADRETEAMVVVLLDTRNHVIGATTVYEGNVSASIIRVGELFREAVRLNAAGIILAHNHPSGDPTPSPDDLHLTAEALAAGRLLDIDLLDHVVIGSAYVQGEPDFVSLRDRGIAFDRKTTAASLAAMD